MTEDPRTERLREIELDAEFLVVEQLDLLAEVEAQLRAVHHTMRRIEKLRGARYRPGPEPSNGQRRDILQGLSEELQAVEAHLATQHECCRTMQGTVERMQERLKRLKETVGQVPRPTRAEAADKS